MTFTGGAFMLGNISTKILYQNCDTILQVSLKKKDQINENYLQSINNNYAQGLVNVRWEKTATRNVLKYNISNMTALSEYIKQTLSQEKYFELIGQVQKILEFCSNVNIPVDNLILKDPKNVYYDVEKHKLFVVCLPLMENNYKCSNTVKFLSTVNKKSNVSITNGNAMNKYSEFLAEKLILQKGKANKNSCFTYNHLYNFLHDTNNIQPVRNEAVPENIVPNGKAETESFADIRPGRSNNVQDDGEHTILVSQKAKPKAEVYLTDNSGREYPLDHFPFVIGRKKNNDLSLPGSGTVSGEHAAVISEGGEYFIEDRDSANGTFLNSPPDSGQRITKEKLRNGDMIYIYDVPLRFVDESGDSGTVIVGGKNSSAGSTTAVEPKKDTVQTSKNPWLIAYIKSSASDEKIPVYNYPFTCHELPGIMIGQETSGSRHSIYISNFSCDSLSVEGNELRKGEKTDIFSGCKFLCGGVTYTFYEEN